MCTMRKKCGKAFMSKSNLKSHLQVHLKELKNSNCSEVPTINVLSKNIKNVLNLHLKIVIFTLVKIAVYCIGVTKAI